MKNLGLPGTFVVFVADFKPDTRGGDWRIGSRHFPTRGHEALTEQQEKEYVHGMQAAIVQQVWNTHQYEWVFPGT